ncbi:Glycosyl transferase [Parasponia andersonii]|uniref:Glycosyl transferase n=1 Tax=Parasponia andersonii TaxID=3476 RepID=A0A2P5BJ56_PARAD|nr:Glycosyl transferase [Parasponia andersonii]
MDIGCEFSNNNQQVGKGRDVGLNQIALFEGKVAGGNGEQVLSRDVYRLGQLFDFFRMMSFYFTTVGYYFCTMELIAVDFSPHKHCSLYRVLFVQELLALFLLTVLTVYIFLYGKAYLLTLDTIADSRHAVTNNTADSRHVISNTSSSWLKDVFHSQLAY